MRSPLGALNNWCFTLLGSKESSFVVNPRGSRNCPWDAILLGFQCASVGSAVKHRRGCHGSHVTGSSGSGQPRVSPLTPASCPSSHLQKPFPSGCSSCVRILNETVLLSVRDGELLLACKMLWGRLYTYSFLRIDGYCNLLWNIDHLLHPSPPLPFTSEAGALRIWLEVLSIAGEQVGEGTTHHGYSDMG